MSTSIPAPLGVVAHYNLLERLEPSGPGDLYRARDTRLGRTVTSHEIVVSDDQGRRLCTARITNLIVDAEAPSS